MTSSSQAWKRPKSPSAGARSLISHLQPGQKIVPVGSPLGLDKVYQAIHGSRVGPPLPVSKYVLAWTNVNGRHDKLATPLKGVLSLESGQHNFREILVNTNVGNGHDASVYFGNEDFIRVLVDAWCRASRRMKISEGCPS